MTRRVAGIDCGTNSIRLLIADVDAEGRLHDVVRRMEVVRLGEGVDQTGRLSEAALERTRAALADYTAQIREHGAEAIRMVATSASRDAQNAGDFKAMVESVLGQAPEVITGDEEARLSFTGAVATLPPHEGQRLLIDIGGGSTEFVRGTGADVAAAISVDVGCVRMTERHLHSDPPSPGEIDAAVADITAVADKALAVADADREATELVAVAGTATTIAAISLDLDAYDPDAIDGTRLTYAEVARVAADLAAADHAARLAIPVMHPGRADVIVGGALVLRTVMERSGIDAVLISEHDILDGIALSA
ncbi:Ppx/GppA phosphatase family protein [Glycomyces harbinensis]|uniref:Exopolyphosphatase / guanosine-5'-triphosphate,3'-diphosphate pyrophosphatase n=1 Tax=Glycomyces harbinensis TaxID=58114 RepID=A0A1G7BLC6_9ACTN|nr:Ppx/GppA phosphatase family protein [Glycomyces harbinensis]SDE27753.1 exopolyphosphatase / guanosine-5'-triphosphate,3'-diphosphate pyrophosphatase [Glycomyces harbinensis]